MFNSVLHNYPSSLDDKQQRAYISVLLQIADVDGISDGELGLIKEMAKTSSVSEELLSDCLLNYKSYDLSLLPDYHISWAFCIIRDAIAIANIDNGISNEEIKFMSKICGYLDINDTTLEMITIATKDQMRISEVWASVMSN
jgi:hypothetical protein